MPMYDRVCYSCKAVKLDSLERVKDDAPLPCSCGGELVRGFAENRANTVIGDDIPGGIEIKHGICYEDGTPRRFYTRSEIRRAAREKGWRWGGDLTGTAHATSKETDKNPHTTRWDTAPGSLTEDDERRRIAAWHEHERKLAAGEL